MSGCPVGYYGDDCKQECPSTCNEGICDPDTGHCLHGCKYGGDNQHCTLGKAISFCHFYELDNCRSVSPFEINL